MAEERKEELKNTNYELFILALSILSLFNWILYFLPLDDNVERVVLTVDLVLSFIFLADFFYRLYTAKSKRTYFIRQYGWLDLLGSLPFPRAKIARLGRVIRAIRLMREYGFQKMVGEFLENRAGTAVYAVGFLIILVLEFGSLSILAVEQRAPEANILTADDALWWSIVTVSTVGYGDQFPVTVPGRLIAILVIVIGVGLFGVVTGFLSDLFISDDNGASGQEPSAIPLGDSTAILEEIGRLRQEQQKAYTEFNQKLESLFIRLEETK